MKKKKESEVYKIRCVLRCPNKEWRQTQKNYRGESSSKLSFNQWVLNNLPFAPEEIEGRIQEDGISEIIVVILFSLLIYLLIIIL